MSRIPRLWVSIIVAASSLPLAGCITLPMRHEERPPVSAIIGTPTESHWSSTTWEAAATPANRHALEQGRPITLVGEVVDVSCFLQMGKRGEAHIACGQKCARNGEPIGLVTDDGELYILMPEEHHPRRDGRISLRDHFIELMGKRVQISGVTATSHNVRALFVRMLPKEP